MGVRSAYIILSEPDDDCLLEWMGPGDDCVFEWVGGDEDCSGGDYIISEWLWIKVLWKCGGSSVRNSPTYRFSISITYMW